MSVQTPSRALTAALDAHEIPYEVIPHTRTVTAADEAAAIGVEPGHVAKTLVLRTDERLIRAVLPASRRIDLRKVRAVLGDKEVELASEQILAGAYPEFELGAVPPIGGPGPDPVLIDRRIESEDWVVFEAGTHEHSVRMATADLLSVAHARVADICQD
jgi:Ala-tRNA(Pro) deacylase